MADPVGATLGVLGLFSVCVQAFNMIQVGQGQDRDLKILSTKLDNQKARFIMWGLALGLHDPECYDTRLDHPVRKDRICQTMVLVNDIFSEGDHLKESYGIRPDRASYDAAAHVTGNEGSVWRDTFRRINARIHRQDGARAASSSDRPSQRSTFRWVISDQEKFLALVGDLRDLVDDLISLTSFSEIEERRRRIANYEVESINDLGSLEFIQDARSGEHDDLSDTATSRLRTLQGDIGTIDTIDTRIGDMSVADSFHTALTTYDDQSNVKPLHYEEPSDEDDGISRMVPQNQRIMKRYPQRPLDTFKPLIRSQDYNPTNSNAIFAQIVHDNKALRMPRAGNTRLAQEFEHATRLSATDMITLAPITVEHVFEVLGTLHGPTDSLIEHGIYYVQLRIPQSYPLDPPLVRLLTKVYHPNIDPRGKICMDVLEYKWSPVLSVAKILLSILALLQEPNPEDPLVPEIAATFVKDRALYEENVRLYTRRYATGERPSDEVIQANLPSPYELYRGPNNM